MSISVIVHFWSQKCEENQRLPCTQFWRWGTGSETRAMISVLFGNSWQLRLTTDFLAPMRFVTVNGWKIHRTSRAFVDKLLARFLASSGNAGDCGELLRLDVIRAGSRHRSGGISNERTKAPSLASSSSLLFSSLLFLCPPATVVIRSNAKFLTIINRRSKYRDTGNFTTFLVFFFFCYAVICCPSLCSFFL